MIETPEQFARRLDPGSAAEDDPAYVDEALHALRLSTEVIRARDLHLAERFEALADECARIAEAHRKLCEALDSDGFPEGDALADHVRSEMTIAEYRHRAATLRTIAGELRITSVAVGVTGP